MVRNYFQCVWWIHADADAPVTLPARVGDGGVARKVDEFADGGLRGPLGDPQLGTARKGGLRRVRVMSGVRGPRARTIATR